MSVPKKPQKISKGTSKTSEPVRTVARVYQFDSFLLNQAERVLLCDGTPVALTPKVFDILSVLVANAGHLVTKATLLEKVWPNAFVEEANLGVNIAVLRKSLGKRADGQPYIETVRKSGYRFVPKVREIKEESTLKLRSEGQET